jgi:hypothetical protein
MILPSLEGKLMCDRMAGTFHNQMRRSRQVAPRCEKFFAFPPPLVYPAEINFNHHKQRLWKSNLS